MTQYRWADCPTPIYNQVRDLLAGVRAILGNNLVGLYLHGSLAMGCFQPERSDIDLLVVSHGPMTIYEKFVAAELLLTLSLQPRPIEVSFLTHKQLHPWRHPAPYDFHYGEDHRDRMAADLADEGWRAWNDVRRRDPDLAAHVAVTRARGICVFGQPIPDLFPEVPMEDYMAAVVDDFHWAQGYLETNATYAILNGCRILAYQDDGRILSKDEGGVWGLANMPASHHPLIALALKDYRTNHNPPFDPTAIGSFMTFAKKRIGDP